MAERGTTPRSRRQRLRRTILWLVLSAAVVAAAATALYVKSRPADYRPGESMADIRSDLMRGLPAHAPRPLLVDASVTAGLAELLEFSGDRSSQLPEDMGPGAAWGDFDGDGDEDLFLVAAGAALGRPVGERAPSRLLENLGDGTFRPVESFPEVRILGMAAAWADFDADGRLDLAVSGFDSLLLFRNTPEGFVRDPRLPELAGFWSGLTWADYDRDGDVDLYVSGYVQYRAEDADRARSSSQYGEQVPFTLNPASYRPERNLLFRNDGARFVEVAGELGVDNLEGRSMGALWHDFDDDGWVDLYVANDISDNVFYHNVAGRFEEISHAAWVADYRGAMGLAAGDWNRDGDDDLFVTHWVAQENALYDSQLVDFRTRRKPSPEAASEPPLRFVDVADQRGLGQIALRSVGWGTEFVDLDGDGWLDLVVANGSTFETADVPKRLRPERSFVFWNAKGEHFHDLAPMVEGLSQPQVARGLALADYDNDGDVDLLFVRRHAGPLLLRNEMQRGNWLVLRLRAERPPFEPLGASVVAYVDGVALRRGVGGASYLSQSSRVVHFGLGDANEVDAVEVRWPDGRRERFGKLAANAMWELTAGGGTKRVVSAAAVEPAAIAVDAAGGAITDRERTLAFWAAHRAGMDAMKIEGDLVAALVHFRRALTLDPRHEDARYYLAHCLAEQGQSAEARTELTTLIDQNPASHRGLKQLGILMAREAQTPEELAQTSAVLERARAVNPEETGVLQVLGELDLLRGNLPSATERLRWVVRTNPRAAGAHFLLGYLAWRAGDAKGAAERLVQTRKALGDEWTPQGTTSEGDVKRAMHADDTPLSRFLAVWDGTPDAGRAYEALSAHLAKWGN